MPAAQTASMPPILYAEASVRSVGGVSLFATTEPPTSDNVHNFFSESQLIETAVQKLRTEGFEVLNVGSTTLTVGAKPEVYERVFRTKLIAEERPTTKHFGVSDTATYIDCPETEIAGLIDVSKSGLSDVLEGVAINEPYYYMQLAAPVSAAQAAGPVLMPMAGAVPAPFAPTKGYWHLTVPGDVSLALNADRAHRLGFTGKGVKAVMIDSGWYAHPYFSSRGYRSTPVVLGPAAANPDHDEVGHGTGESANLFAVAPDVTFTMVKLNFVNTIGAINAAVALKPKVISCSWGQDVRHGPLSAAQLAMAAAVANAVRLGIVVVFSAGNGQWGFPAQHPDVIAAGGTYVRQDGTFEATPYASGFLSPVYRGRIVPDVCGAVGLPPRAAYIMLPLEPGDQIDRDLANGGAFPNGDETAPNDGWAAFSGTSAAAPQVAGAVALLLQACSRLSPAAVKDILKRTARDVITGQCQQGFPAVPGPDQATGAGFTDAYRAAVMARLRCLIVRPPVGTIPPIVKAPITVPPSPPGPAPVAEEAEIAEAEEMIMDLWK